MPEDKGPTSPRAEREEKVLAFWKEHDIFKKTLDKESPKGEFVFYEGPPTANAKPAFHHLEARAFKDAVPRYKTMAGFHVRRKAGWDTHGLPVELQIEKQLGFKSKKEIEEYGIEKFNKLCRESVFTYIGDWAKFTDRIGYWVNLDDAYYTFNNSYIESVWSVMSHVEKRGLLYKDYKVVPWCPRCGTALSSHELAQGYQDVKDLSLYVKFKIAGEQNTFILAWTTTPWTLPGNVALAVGKDIEYVKAKVDEEFFILAESKLALLPEGFEIVQRMKGEDLVGRAYEPLYPFVRDIASESEQQKLLNAFKVYAADFVTTEDGTGIVHTAVMYGQEDFDLGTKVGLPKVHLVAPDGTFVRGTGWFEGRSVVDETLAVDVLKDLQAKGNFFNKENHAHSYPFCWRCKTRLIYYARDSWYIRMSALRDELVAENEKINWEPAYIKEGRFGDWLREVKDWAISRERYWGTPLPVWQSAEGERIVVDSIETLRTYTKKSGNSYFVMRHGGTEGNKAEVVSYAKQADDHLTEEGREGVRASAEVLKDQNFDVIIASPFTRTRETAEIVATAMSKKPELVFDDRLREVDPGEYDAKPWLRYHEAMAREKEWFTTQVPGGESLQDVYGRVSKLLYELETKYKDKKILIVTHGGPAWLMFVASGLHLPHGKSYAMPDLHADTKIFVPDFQRFRNAEVRELPFVPMPHDEKFELDLHKPFIDSVVLEKDGKQYERVREVMDVWLDSGSMPFAQDPHNLLYPADFISEAIDQTRGWFYTLHAVGVLMEKGRAFKNAICLGHILDKEGKKMSKSIGNVIDPWEMINKYGVDTLRLWMYGVNQPGESKSFDERSVDELQKRVFNLLDNMYSFYELYRDEALEKKAFSQETPHPLDAWILVRLSELTELMTARLEAYQLLEPVRALRDFIDDLSTWYVRRSRDRMKDGDEAVKQTFYFVLKELSKLMAPFAPFAAEDLYQKLRLEEEPMSVHLAAWPEAGSFDKDAAQDLLTHMNEVRTLVTLALEARQKVNIKIRQPLSELKVKSALDPKFLEIIKEELNVKLVTSDLSLSESVQLDTTLTPELVEEGKVRDLVRRIQDLRKEKNLRPGELMHYDIPEEEKVLFERHGDAIRKATSVEF